MGRRCWCRCVAIAEVWSELQAQVEELTGQAGLQILRDLGKRSDEPSRLASANPSAGCVRWGKQRVM